MTDEHDVDSQQEFLTFLLGDEQYGIDIMSVKEIRGYDNVTRIANAPAFIKGVINMRGEIVPIVDLRIKFQQKQPTYDEFTIVIVVQVHDRLVGMVVDGVSDVVGFTPEEIRPSPDFGTAFDSRYLSGLGSKDKDMVILVNIEALVTSQELGLIDQNRSTYS
ncbi:chemotaxis protein CheW [Reinekea blandensis]|uniref:Chemotaxis protein CheW n=1 Tax=Reinekea blandensis MED297 TaxID=314283 RepID=A4BJG4_9GAMM|nr:chemotaxis protein CheW [Reinekea blandensis]EAR07736.1 purine-binding chemotaxis protein CheW [Reinekea sp. MED297] [Reinekea blandensis MED297]